MKWKVILAWTLLTALALAIPTARMLTAARGHLGDRYSAEYFSGGRPPRGQSACVDVVVSACRATGLDLQSEIQRDSTQVNYPLIRDRNIDHRWAPNLNYWLRRHARKLPNDRDFRPADLIFWSLLNDGVADHCGVLTEKRGPTGKLQVVHQFPPECREEDCLGRWTVVGHYRLL